MKKIFLGLSLLATLTVACFSQVQPPQIQWQKSLGGTNHDMAHSIQQTTDNGYIVVGSSSSNDGDVNGNHGAGDYWIVKLNTLGNIQWQKCLGGTGSDNPSSIQETNDGGYIIAGSSSSSSGGHGGDDYWIVKLDSVANIQWQKSLGGTLGEACFFTQQTTDNGYIVAGCSPSNNGNVTGHHGSSSYYDYWIVKLDNNGNIQWQKSLGGTGSDVATSVQQTTDGGYIIAGSSGSNDGDITGHHGAGATDGWVVKLDPLGNIQWQKSLGGTGSDWAKSIQQTFDGGYIFVGMTFSNDGDVIGNHGVIDYWVVKLDSIGNITWQKCLGGTGQDDGYFIRQTSDSGYIVAGKSGSNDGDVTGHHGSGGANGPYDYWVVKLDNIGNIEWQKSLGGTLTDEATWVEQTSDGYIVAGYTLSNDGDITGAHGNADYWIVKLACLNSISNQVSSDSLSTSVLSSVDTLVTLQIDTVGNNIVTTTNNLIISTHTNTLAITTDSTVITTNQCTGLITDSTTYSNVISSQTILVDTVGNTSMSTVSCPTFDSIEVMFDTTNTSALVNIQTFVTTETDTVGSNIITTIDSLIVTTFTQTMTVIKDSTVTTTSLCDGSITNSVTYSDTTSNSMLIPDSVTHHSTDTVACPTSQYSHIEFDSSETSALVSVDTIVTVQVDTVFNNIITTIDSMFVSTYHNTTDITKDSTVFTVNECTGLIVDSVAYFSFNSSSADVLDTLQHTSVDTVLIMLGIGNAGVPSSIKVYPNPFRDILTIDIGNDIADGILTDPLGRVVRRMKCTGNTVLFFDIPSGVYFLRLNFKNKSPITIKLVAE